MADQTCNETAARTAAIVSPRTSVASDSSYWQVQTWLAAYDQQGIWRQRQLLRRSSARGRRQRLVSIDSAWAAQVGAGQPSRRRGQVPCFHMVQAVTCAGRANFCAQQLGDPP